MNNLKLLQPTLYRRIRLKAIIHGIFGLILAFFPAQAPSLQHTPLLAFFGVYVIAAVYLIIGFGLMFALRFDKDKHTCIQSILRFAFMFDLLIFLSLFAVFAESRTTAFLMAIYGYLTYNVYYVSKEPSWKALVISKEIVEDATSTRNLSK